jgi:Protein of unknown function (DUF998)
MIIFGGLFNSIHTALFREISFLISPYTFNGETTIPLYRIYNIQLLLFSLFLFIRIKNIFVRLGTLYLSMSASMGILLIKYPMDPIGISGTFSGITHIIFVLITFIYIVIALLLFGVGFKKNKNLIALSKYSFEISMIILVAGFITVIFALSSMPEYVGFFQKLPIFSFLIWILLASYWIIKSDKRIKYQHKQKK